MDKKPKPKLNPKQYAAQRTSKVAERLRVKHAESCPPKTICLNMIVKNESPIMVRLLDSLVTIIDFISIVDTGSTDDTKEVIMDWSAKHNIPATVHFEPFKNFSYNRTHSLEKARSTYPQADYLLLSDADFIWEVDASAKFDKRLLVDHKYLVEQRNNALNYWNIRLVSTKVKFIFLARTHEYITEASTQEAFVGNVRISKLRALLILDIEDGKSKGDKYSRDERLLKEGLADESEPAHIKTRYKFYLAQTLKDMGRFDESIEWYTKRAEDKGWGEEVYYAKFQIGFNHERLGWDKKKVISVMAKETRSEEENELLIKYNQNNLAPSEMLKQSTEHFTQAAINYMAATSYRKTRNEALYYCTRMYRMLSMHQMAYDLVQKGKPYPYPDEDTLFIEKACYDGSNWDIELSIVCYYLPEHKQEGREALHRLLARKDVPKWVTEMAERNASQYL